MEELREGIPGMYRGYDFFNRLRSAKAFSLAKGEAESNSIAFSSSACLVGLNARLTGFVESKACSLLLPPASLCCSRVGNASISPEANLYRSAIAWCLCVYSLDCNN